MNMISIYDNLFSNLLLIDLFISERFLIIVKTEMSTLNIIRQINNNYK